VRWIDVMAHLPEKHEHVLVCDAWRNEQGLGWLDSKGRWLTTGQNVKNISHWQPLPESPDVRYCD
jgi:hypothetical protein